MEMNVGAKQHSDDVSSKKSNLKNVPHNWNFTCKENQKLMFSKEYQMLIIHDRHESTFGPKPVFGIVKLFKGRLNFNNFY